MVRTNLFLLYSKTAYQHLICTANKKQQQMFKGSKLKISASQFDIPNFNFSFSPQTDFPIENVLKQILPLLECLLQVCPIDNLPIQIILHRFPRYLFFYTESPYAELIYPDFSYSESPCLESSYSDIPTHRFPTKVFLSRTSLFSMSLFRVFPF